jgi:glycosyltransferase involved in cell wall biosynthesis/RimJ/RimL family protein N-acetyltransferase
MRKVLIRPLIIADAQNSWAWRNNPKVWQLTGSSPNQQITCEIEYQWIKKVLSDQTARRFAIVVDDIYVGNIQLTDILENDSAEFHVFIGDTAYWGKGIGRLATNQILYYAKEVLNLKNVSLKVKKENASAINVYSNNGFTITEEEEEWLKMDCDISDLESPIVSVFVMVYNHEIFLADCLDGLLMQKCNFNFDIVVGEDCSVDNSREILLDYQNKYPGKFKLLLHKNNIGANQNQLEVLKNCKGKYIAFCEGDDYWTDPLKLQKQVDFLEGNPDYSMCCGGYISNNVISKEQNTHIINRSASDSGNQCGFTFTLNDTRKLWITKTLTSMFRKSAFDFAVLDKYKHLRDVHLFYHLLVGKKGFYFKSVFGLYNIHLGGVNSMQQGQVNINAAYLYYTELHYFNRDKFTREMAFKASIVLFNFDMHNNYLSNNFNKRIKLLKELVFLIRDLKDIKTIGRSFL